MRRNIDCSFEGAYLLIVLERWNNTLKMFPLLFILVRIVNFSRICIVLRFHFYTRTRKPYFFLISLLTRCSVAASSAQALRRVSKTAARLVLRLHRFHARWQTVPLPIIHYCRCDGSIVKYSLNQMILAMPRIFSFTNYYQLSRYNWNFHEINYLTYRSNFTVRYLFKSVRF